MRRPTLPLLLLLPVTALAQGEPPGRDQARASTPPAPDPEAEDAARAFFAALLAGDARGAAALGASPFLLEGRRVPTRELLVAEWAQNLRATRGAALTLALESLELLGPEAMEARHGKPPARLNLPADWKAPGTWVALATVSGRPAVALLRRQGQAWRVLAFSD